MESLACPFSSAGGQSYLIFKRKQPLPFPTFGVLGIYGFFAQMPFTPRGGMFFIFSDLFKQQSVPQRLCSRPEVESQNLNHSIPLEDVDPARLALAW